MCRPWKRVVRELEVERVGCGRVVVGSAEVKVSSLSSSGEGVGISGSVEGSIVEVRDANFDGKVASCLVVSLIG